jgi:hypothetical protein
MVPHFESSLLAEYDCPLVHPSKLLNVFFWETCIVLFDLKHSFMTS